MGLASAALIALAAAVATLALAWAWAAAAARLLRLPEFFDEVRPVQTGDGATIVLARLRPIGEPSRSAPVLLCHGLAMNRRAFALEPDRCFARALAQHGRDVWILELRGAAEGKVPPSMRSACFDDYAAHDVPRAIAEVLARTGASELDWVGFSMGGMLGYAHLGARGGAGVRRFVTIGSPVHFEAQPVARGLAVLPMALAPVLWLRRTPFRLLALVAAPVVWPGLPHALSTGLRGEHYSARALRRVMANALADVPSGVSRQFVRWIRRGTFDSNDGAYDYLAGLAKVTVPTLVIAGSGDRLATPAAVLEAPTRLGAAEVETCVIGKRSGAAREYDHLDLILGRESLDEVFPEVLRWLER